MAKKTKKKPTITLAEKDVAVLQKAIEDALRAKSDEAEREMKRAIKEKHGLDRVVEHATRSMALFDLSDIFYLEDYVDFEEPVADDGEAD